MQKSVIHFIAIAGLMFSNSTLAINNKHDGCADMLNNLEGRIYDQLFIDSGKNGVDEALDTLKKIKDDCELKDEDLALIYDMKGEATLVAYKYTKDEDFFAISEESYKRALSYKTSRNEYIYWHLSRLMRLAKKYDEAVKYINIVLNMEPKPKEPLPYLQTAFQLAVDTEQWDDAKGLIEAVSHRDPHFYRDPGLLLSAVETVCHFNQLNDAQIMIKNVDAYLVKKSNADGEPIDKAALELVQLSKNTVQNCKQAK